MGKITKMMFTITMKIFGGRSLIESRLKELNKNTEEKESKIRLENILEAIKKQDKEALKSLFSKKAIENSDDFEGGMNSLFDFIQGDIDSWEAGGWSSEQSIEYGKKSLMIRPNFKIKTNVPEYDFFLIDYAIDTIDPENEGVYMLEVSESSYTGEWEAWTNRMRAGISIVQ